MTNFNTKTCIQQLSSTFQIWVCSHQQYQVGHFVQKLKAEYIPSWRAFAQKQCLNYNYSHHQAGKQCTSINRRPQALRLFCQEIKLWSSQLKAKMKLCQQIYKIKNHWDHRLQLASQTRLDQLPLACLPTHSARLGSQLESWTFSRRSLFCQLYL